MRVLLITPSFAPFTSGTAVLAAKIAQSLVSYRHYVVVLTTQARSADEFWEPPDDIRLPRHEIITDIQVERLPIAYPWPAPYAFGLVRRAGHWLHRTGLPLAIQRPLLRQSAHWMPPLPDLQEALDRLVPWADLVHSFDSSWDGLFTAAAAKAQCCRKSFVATPLMHLGDAGVRAHFQMAHQVDAYRQADAVLALSQAEAAEYLRLGITPGRIHVIPPGVELLPHEDNPVAAAAFRKEHGLTKPLVAFLGANTYDKGAFTLALAVAQLAAASSPVTAVYAGPESTRLRAFLEHQPTAIQAHLHDRIRILGVVNEETKHQLLAACDMLALPSQVDTFGIVLLEAWLHSKPVIGAAAGGIPEVIRDGETGLLVPFGDAKALAAAIKRLSEMPAWARRLGEAGRELVLQQYTWDRTYQRLSQVYTDLLT